MLSPLRSSNVPDRGAAFLLPAALVDDCRNGEHDEDQRQTDDRDGVALTAMHAALRAASLDHLVGAGEQRWQSKFGCARHDPCPPHQSAFSPWICQSVGRLPTPSADVTVPPFISHIATPPLRPFCSTQAPIGRRSPAAVLSRSRTSRLLSASPSRRAASEQRRESGLPLVAFRIDPS